jgi:hypothetical protein
VDAVVGGGQDVVARPLELVSASVKLFFPCRRHSPIHDEIDDSDGKKIQSSWIERNPFHVSPTTITGENERKNEEQTKAFAHVDF